jgi:hypothetical protein
MRAPSPSFRAELAAYREKLIADNGRSPQLQPWVKVLDDWAKHAAAEDIWRTVKERIPPENLLTAEEFIFLVLDFRFRLEPVNRVTSELRTAERRIDHLAKLNLKERNRAKRALEYARLAHVNGLFANVLDRSATLLGREKKTAVRNMFVMTWRDKFRENCGQPLDEVVRVLAEVAFGEKDLTLETIRGAGRRTTRGKRRKQTP